MSRVNAHVQIELERLAGERLTGEREGYEADPNILPAFFNKQVVNLTARERGYWFGRELRLMETQS